MGPGRRATGLARRARRAVAPAGRRRDAGVRPAIRPRAAGHPNLVAAGPVRATDATPWHHAGMERTYTAPLLDKLGVRFGARVVVVGIDDPAFLAELSTRASVHAAAASGAGADLVFFAADDTAALGRLPALREAIYPGGAIWVVSRKGRSATLRDVEVMAAAREAGLVDNKVVSFSATHTALRLVVPRSQR